MRPEDRATARRQLDKRLNSWRELHNQVRPPRGWIKAIREALGMTAAQLAERLGVSQPRVFTMEKAEATGAITLDSLERAANALDCQLVYALVPRKPLDQLVRERAEIKAKQRLKSASHTMVLEAQGVDAADEREQFEHLVRQLIEKGGSKLWEADA
ncbi:MAG: mobile mystery protein A [Gammaproteobacteria bacterium]|nr:mobile mystery protein A [Gammaproteobacteria bacterium]